MEEKKIGLIPKVVIQGAMGPKQYGVLLTDRRSIFVQETSSKAAVGYFIGGIAGAAIASSLESKKETDYFNEDINTLVNNGKNTIVFHSLIKEISIKKGLSGYSLRIDYGKDKIKSKIVSILEPPATLIEQKKSEGKKVKEIKREYAENVRKIFEQALPPEIAQKIEVGF